MIHDSSPLFLKNHFNREFKANSSLLFKGDGTSKTNNYEHSCSVLYARVKHRTFINITNDQIQNKTDIDVNGIHK